ncbi:zinc-binding alcohol dehydrogenase family protein [Rhodococcus erythropolis]|uniref:zinc-binding alcohol dehydrogenase family protein n=1 Tax=Rhodococcus erythropolis TaxID=1833 RepID=UPI0037AA10AD
MPNHTMRALVHSQTPGPDGLRMEDVPRPRPAEGEVLVKVFAAGLNRHELFVIDQHNDSDSKIVGADAVGTIVETGIDAGQELAGNSVLINPCLGWHNTDDVPEVPTILGGPIQGTFAEYVSIPADNVHPIPAHLSPTEAAALPLAALTAHRALFTQGDVRSGEHVVITGATGGAGVIAVAMATAAGAEVTAVTRDASKAEALRAVGAAHVIVSGSDFDQRLHTPADVVLDSVGASMYPAILHALRPGGRIVSFGATSSPDIELSLRDLFFRQISLRGTSMGSSEEFAQMISFVSKHRIVPTIDTVCPLEEAPEAFRRMSIGSGVGKTVFTLSNERFPLPR